MYYAIGDSAVLFFSHDQSIRAINLHDHNKSVLFDHLDGVFSLDIDYHNNMVCIIICIHVINELSRVTVTMHAGWIQYFILNLVR